MFSGLLNSGGASKWVKTISLNKIVKGKPTFCLLSDIYLFSSSDLCHLVNCFQQQWNDLHRSKSEAHLSNTCWLHWQPVCHNQIYSRWVESRWKSHKSDIIRHQKSDRPKWFFPTQQPNSQNIFLWKTENNVRFKD